MNRSTKLWGMVAAWMLCATTAFALEKGLLVQPTRQQLRTYPVLAKLKRPVNASYVDTPLESIIRHLQRQTGITIVLDHKDLGPDVRRQPLDLVLEGAPAGEVLYWVLRLAGLDFEIRGQVLYISSQAKLMVKRIQFKIYNVLDLTRAITHFPGPDLRLQTGSVTSDKILTQESPVSFEKGSLAELIETHVRPESWAVELGTSIEERNQKLVVVHTPEVHAEIAHFLDELRARTGKMVAFEARVLRASPRVIAGLLGERAREPYLSAEEVRTVERLIRSRQVEVIATLRTTCHNKQRVHVLGGSKQLYVADYDVTGGMFDPVIRTFINGTMLEVKPTLIQDTGRVKLDLRLQVSSLRSLVRFYPLGGPRPDEGAVPFDPATQRLKKMPTKIRKSPGTHLGPGVLELPQINLIHVETTVVCPLGGTVFFTAEDPQGAAGQKRREILFLLKPQLVSFTAGAGARR